MKATLPSTLPISTPRPARWRCVSGASRKGDLETFPAPNGRRRCQLQRVVTDVPLGQAVEQLLERDFGLESREVGAEAVVDALPEGEMWAVLAADVVDIGTAITLRVAIRRSHQQ